MPARMRFDSAKSTMRKWPPKGSADLGRSSVSTESSPTRPPASTMAVVRGSLMRESISGDPTSLAARQSHDPRLSGRGFARIVLRRGGTRTPNLRFWRPLLCQLSYTPNSAPVIGRTDRDLEPYYNQPAEQGQDPNQPGRRRQGSGVAGVGAGTESRSDRGDRPGRRPGAPSNASRCGRRPVRACSCSCLRAHLRSEALHQRRQRRLHAASRTAC